MLIQDVINELEILAPPSLQESYDNVGLLTGNKNWNCTGVLCCLDVLENVVQEAIAKKCNLIVAHHPIIFGGLKKINGNNYVERVIIAAIKNDIAIYAIHTNLDNVLHGVNQTIAQKIGLQKTTILAPKAKQLKKLYTYIVPQHFEKLKEGLLASGAGKIGNYSDCSFSVQGQGTFKGNENANPVIGTKLQRSTETEIKIEVLYEAWREKDVIEALQQSHSYETVAYEIISIDNAHQEIGSGLIGQLPKPISEKQFFGLLKEAFGLKIIRHTALLQKKIRTVAVCGGSGSFLIINALRAKADVFVTADVKYHEFFDADGKMLIADIGHYESEQFTIDLIFDKIRQKFPNFAVLKTKVKTNSIQYYL
jgi:dinuclear metal center YbgI/SA1388 family protein